MNKVEIIDLSAPGHSIKALLVVPVDDFVWKCCFWSRRKRLEAKWFFFVIFAVSATRIKPRPRSAKTIAEPTRAHATSR